MAGILSAGGQGVREAVMEEKPRVFVLPQILVPNSAIA
jgi:hypothetical protein